ncbi:MAG: hypothetical protein JXA69_10590, partial [Phycisphaerae bacterium]|nr:hypothetical protein [Phycisphaerae bacterium]
MSDESQELRRINWTECFAFTQIFRTFRLAIQPNKLALAAIGLVATCLVGWVLDAIWCAADTYALPREIAAFVRPGDLDDWRTGQIAGGKMTVQKILAAGTVVQKDREIKDDKTYWKLVDELPDDVRDHYVEMLDAIDGTDKVEELQALCAKMTLPGELPVLLSGKTADELKAIARTRAYEVHADALAQLDALAPQGIFQSFRRCCASAFLDMVSAATRLDVFGGMNQVLGVGEAAPRIVGIGGERPGVLPSLCMILHGVKWLVVEHWLYALVWGLLVLAIWSLA